MEIGLHYLQKRISRVKKLKFPSVIKRAIEKANDEKGYKIIGEVFAKKLNRYWYWKQLKIDNPDYVVYSMRHSFAWHAGGQRFVSAWLH